MKYKIVGRYIYKTTEFGPFATKRLANKKLKEMKKSVESQSYGFVGCVVKLIK